MFHVESTTAELSGIFMLSDRRWREKIYVGGLLLLLLPPFGWPAALGYRKALVHELLTDSARMLPEWDGKRAYYFLEGLKAMGVIFGYFFPLYLILLSVLFANNIYPTSSWLYPIGFFAVFPIFSTLSFPLAVLYWTFCSSQFSLPLPLAGLLLFLFVLTTFLIPAGFLQVSLSGHYVSAFRIDRALLLVKRNFKEYLRAWYYSGLMSLIGHFALPFSPWGVVWCYLGIIFIFNSILDSANQTAHTSWIHRVRAESIFSITPTQRQYLKQVHLEGRGEEHRALAVCFGRLLIPLPRILQKHIEGSV